MKRDKCALIAKYIVRPVAIFVLIGMAATSSGESMSPESWHALNRSAEAIFDDLADKVARGETPPIKCATPIVHALISGHSKGTDTKVLYPGREDTMSFTHPTNHFLLHYTDNGTHRVYNYDVQTIEPGIPDYIVMAGRILDSVWVHTVDELGFMPPVSDGFYNGGGDSLLDVYFIHLAAYGMTVTDSLLATFPLTATAYIFLENDYEGFPGYVSNRLDALRVTAAHEFFHCVQFAIDAAEVEGSVENINPAWVEMSATFMEEEHYDDINDYYNYLTFFYDQPQWSIRTGTYRVSPAIEYFRNLHMYGSVVFPIFLAEQFGSGVIRAIWEGCGQQSGPNWVEAADDAIRQLSGEAADLRHMYQEFAVWNFFTKHRFRSGVFFPEGAEYDSVNLAAQVSSYPTTIAFQDLDPPQDSILPDNLGANYFILGNISALASGLALSFEANPLYSWGITIVRYEDNLYDGISVQHIRSDTLTGTIVIPDAADYDNLAIIVTVLSGDALQEPYSLTLTIASDVVDEDDRPEPVEYSLAQNRPNPFNPATVIPFTTTEREYVRIAVTNLLGQHIRILEDKPVPAGRHTVIWDGCDSNGKAVPSGIYFYTLTAGGITETRKMLLLK